MKVHELFGIALTAVITGCGSAEPAPGTTLTYHVDVKPIVDAKCGNCHVEGGIAPFSLTTYAEVNGQKAAIQAAVGAGTMPPWPPAAGCSEYDGDRSLTADEEATLLQWIEGGAPEGDPAAKPKTIASDTTRLSRVDLTLPIPTPYTPQQSPDDYRCFLVDMPNTETTYVTGLGVKPGVTAMVHHVIAFLATPESVAEYQALDDAEAGPGYTCFGGPGGDGRPGWVGGWVPGELGSDYPEGTGIEIPAGSKLIVQVHYNTSTTKAVPDQTSILLKTDPTVAKKAIIMPWADPAWFQSKQMDIPAHTMDATHSFSLDATTIASLSSAGVLADGAPFTLYSAGLHMHTRGTRARTSIHRASGQDECLLDIEKWNFHWQGNYSFSNPKTFQPGDTLSLECHWNNMDAMDVNWGEGTGDEMCLGLFYVTP
jgi:hypothetical protein